MKKILSVGFVLCLFGFSLLGQSSIESIIDAKAASIEEKVVQWRRHLHQNPELSNREFETAKYVAKHLRALGNIEVTEGIAITGVKGVLVGGKPGPVIGLRADMDGLPVVERVDVPFRSKAIGEYKGEEVGVMHACGHDTHVAILMGVAEVLSQMQSEIAGTVVFIFQPAEEGAPPGEEGGAKLMVKEGILNNPKVDVIFGLHINSKTPIGKIRYKPGGALAAADVFTITVKGKQTHGSTPWTGVDPIVTSAQIINGLQTIISRQTELTKEAAVISVGKISGGVRNNIIPESCEMVGTIRTLDTEMQDIIHEKIRLVATNIAEANGAEAIVEIRRGVPVTYNNPELTAQMLPTLFKVAGEENVQVVPARTGAEDFSFYANEIPALFFFLGGMPADQHPLDAAPHHTPDFYIDDSKLDLGVRALTNMVFDYAEKVKM